MLLAQFAPSVTNLKATQHDGQTFITWTDAASGVAGEKVRYDLYRQTSGPIKDVGQATLVLRGIYNNSAQIVGPKPFSQATRLDPALAISRVINDRDPLQPWSGLAVHTNIETANAYYAVITRDTTNQQRSSPISPQNSLASPVAESPAAIAPVLQLSSRDSNRKPECCSISGKTHLPLWLRLHGSGGNAASLGDLQAFWGDSTMGHQDGIQSIFSVYEDHFGTAMAKGGARQLIVAPQDAIWSVNGNFGSETFWYGVKDIPDPSKDRTAHVYPYTQARLAFIVPWAIQHYQADPDRIYGISESMGAYGQVQWSLKQPNLFAAIFMRIPILGPWMRIPSLVDVTPDGHPKTVQTTDDTLPNGTLYNEVTDVAAWVAKDCSRNLPYVSWSSGRNDVGLVDHRMWTYAVQMANALKKCHYGFSFIWNNGAHNNSTAGLENRLLEQYQTMFVRNVSYPAFTNFSLDHNYGNSDFKDGDSTGCVNCGWTWKIIEDSAASWIVRINNDQLTSKGSTDITLRNSQLFKPSKGASIIWSTSTGQKGKTIVDVYGLITLTGVELIPSIEIKLSALD